MFKSWKKNRTQRKAEAAKIENDEYLKRLSNSARGLCGSRHVGNGPFLGLDEIKHVMRTELKRKSQAQEA